MNAQRGIALLGAFLIMAATGAALALRRASRPADKPAASGGEHRCDHGPGQPCAHEGDCPHHGKAAKLPKGHPDVAGMKLPPGHPELGAQAGPALDDEKLASGKAADCPFLSSSKKGGRSVARSASAEPAGPTPLEEWMKGEAAPGGSR